MELIDIYRQSIYFFITRYKTLFIAITVLSLLQWLVYPSWAYNGGELTHIDFTNPTIEQFMHIVGGSESFIVLGLRTIVEVFSFAYLLCLFRLIIDHPDANGFQVLLMALRPAPVVCFVCLLAYILLIIILGIAVGVYSVPVLLLKDYPGITSLLVTVGVGLVFYVSCRLILLPVLIADQPSFRLIYLIRQSFGLTRNKMFKILLIMLMYIVVVVFFSTILLTGLLASLGELGNFISVLVLTHLGTFFLIILYRMYIDSVYESDVVRHAE